MGIWDDFESAIRTRTHHSSWKGGSVPLYENAAEWDEWHIRLERYKQNDYYYSNVQYDDVNAILSALRKSGRLYVNTRSIYNPIFRLVNLYADKVYPATLDLINLDSGAVPVVANDRIRKSLIQLFRWSNWNMTKQLYVRTGEKYGDVFLRVSDDVVSRRVVIEVLSPQKVRYVRKDSAGNIKEIWIEYLTKRENRPQVNITTPLVGTPVNPDQVIRVTEVITQDYIIILHDDKPVQSWDNPFGFVPVVHVKAADEGFRYGSARWTVSRTKIDEINSQAALLNDQVRKSIIPYIATIGGALDAKALKRSGATMDEIINIAVGIGGDVKAVVPNVDIASALNNIQAQLDELREENPELFLYQLTDMTVPPSGVALRTFFDLAVNKISGAQGVYDDAFIRCCQMALTIGGVNGYTNFEGYTLESFALGELDFSIRPRDVIFDAIPQVDRLNFLLASGAPQGAIWTALQVSAEDQAKWKQELETQNDAVIEAQLQSIGGVGGNLNTAPLNTENGTQPDNASQAQ